MNTRLDEIASRIYRVSVYIPEADFMFSQFLVDGDEPPLFHTGPRRLFPIVLQALNQVHCRPKCRPPNPYSGRH